MAKMTKTEMYNKIKASLTDKDMIAFIDNEIALIARKNSAPKKPTKTQVENASFKDIILNALTDTMTISDIQNADPALTALSNQRMSAILTQLIEEKKVVRSYQKRKSYFSKA